MSTETAIRILRDHGHSWSFDSAGRLIADVQWAMNDGHGNVSSGTDWELVPMTAQGLRDWLGY